LRYLLDVNAWVALLDEAHVFHAPLLTFMDQPARQIASCPLTENGVIRVLNLPSYSVFGPAGFDTVRLKLQAICSEIDHVFWPDSLSLRDTATINWPRILGHNQITDAYLLALAVSQQGCLLTLDHRISLSTVLGAKEENLLRL
jgi:uncharacterized protein